MHGHQLYLFNINLLSIEDSEDCYKYPSDITVNEKTTSELKFVNFYAISNYLVLFCPKNYTCFARYDL